MKIKLLLIQILTATALFFAGCGDSVKTADTDKVENINNKIVAKAEATSYEVSPGAEVSLSAENSDIGDNSVTYTWTNSKGQRLGTESILTWTAPSQEGNYSITLILNINQENESKDAITITVTKPTEFPTITLQNSQINVGAFDMKSFHFSGGAINTAQMDAYLGIDFIHNELKLLKFPYHEGVVILGKYNASTKSLTLNDTLSLPRTGIKAFTTKLYSGANVKIAIMGDSLLTVSSDPDVREYTWTHLLFDNARADLGFNMPNLSKIRVDNYAIGAQTAEHGLGMLANNVVNTDGSITSQNQDAIDGDYDLYIIGWGANGNTVDNVDGFNKIAYMENIMAKLKNKNVLIINQSAYRNFKDHLAKDAPLLLNIANNFGASYADTWSYTWEESTMYNHDIWAKDGLHWDAEGQVLYAKAIRSAILLAKDVSEKVATNQFQYTDTHIQNLEPFFAMNPIDTTSSSIPIVSTFGYYTNLSLRFNQKNLHRVAVGEYITYHVPTHIGLLGILADSVLDDTVTIRVTIDGISKDIVLPNQAGGRESLLKLDEFYTTQAATTVRIEVLSGTLYIQGILGFQKP